jgi:hypothetical protein
MAEGVTMAQSPQPRPTLTQTQAALVPAIEVALQNPTRLSPNGIRFATFGDIAVTANSHSAIDPSHPDPAGPDIDRLVQTVPPAIAAALTGNAYYFVPLVLAEGRRPADAAAHRSSHEETMVSPIHTIELADQAICHRNVELPNAAGEAGPAEGSSREAVFISTRLLSDRFSLAFEFFINVGHAFVDAAGVPESFAEHVWNQALADVRGETSHDAWETRAHALNHNSSPRTQAPTVAEPEAHSQTQRFESQWTDRPTPLLDMSSLRAAEGSASPPQLPAAEQTAPAPSPRGEYVEAAFADAVAIYLLSLALDFDYSELREREYPLLAPHALAERLRLTHRLYPPNPTYEFAIRYRRRA